ncbi:hypothetical protein [Flavobacterium sp.]|jgi:hypothetical protein|uniref:hypothetical protein n=1 Tax=Flavobacterium sp. TaxID=239 RepID=UPI0037BFFC7F
MRYRNEALRAMQLMPSNYNLGDVLFAVFQTEAVQNGISLDFLRRMDDEDVYTRVEQALKIETAEKELTEEEKQEWIAK